MRVSLIGYVVLAALIYTAPVFAQGTTQPVITSPAAGQVVQGQVAALFAERAESAFL